MGNCLQTQLKATVQNDNLPYFGGAEIEILSDATGSIKTNPGQTAKLISKTDGTVFDISETTIVELSELLEHGSKYIYFSIYDSFLSSGDNGGYSSQGLRGLKTNIEQWKSVNPKCLDKIILTKTDSNFIGSVDALPASNETTTINLSIGPHATLSSLIEKYPNIGKNNGDFILYSGKATGNVSALGGLHYMPKQLQLSSNITGNIYDAIVGWRTNIGETGETPSIVGSNKVSLWSVQFATAISAKVRWTANTSSVTINGVTTTFDNSGNIIT